MENPHEERQAVLLERIIKNVVSAALARDATRSGSTALTVALRPQDKCNEAIMEMNHCLKARPPCPTSLCA